jgi:hypothetical protein
MAAGRRKMSKPEAGYVGSARSPRKQHCGACSMFLAETRRCTLVKGNIDPEGWCQYWERKSPTKRKR